MTKLWEIFRYDVGSQFRRFSTLLYGAGLAIVSLLIASTFLDDARRDGIFLNAPMVTAATMMMTTAVALLVTAALAGEAATRDVQARMEPLLYTTPLRKSTYLSGRFLSAFAIGALLLLVVPLTLLAGAIVPGVDPSYIGPFRPGSYLHAYLIVGLPNIFITTALLFSLVVLSRRQMLGYLGGAVLFMNTIIQDEVVANALGRWDLAKLLDPFAFIIGRAQWRSFSMLQRNTLALELEGALLTNRLLWIGVALAALALVHARFRMAHEVPARLWRRRAIDVPIDVEAKPLAMPRIRGTFSGATRMRQLLAIAFRSFREIITSRAAWMYVLIGLLLFKITPELMEVGPGTPGRPTTGRIALLYSRFSTIGILVGAVIAFFAGQLVWRERDAREHDMADATPVPDAVTLAGKFGGLALLIVTMQVVLTAAGVATQIAYGYDDFELGLYLRMLFGLKLVDSLLFAALAMAVHVIVSQKYLGTTVAMLAWLYAGYAGDLGIEHNLLIYGSDPGIGRSEMSGFAGSLVPWLWFKLYWSGWALLFALLARLFWVRGHEVRRFALARRRFTRVPAFIAAIAVALIAGAGAFVFYNTNVLNEYVTSDEATRRSAEYERRYAKYADLAQPVVAATKLHIELHPKQGSADIRGTYRLENRSGRAIDAIHLVTHQTVPTTSLTFDRAARPTLIDEKHGYRIYALAKPLAPGEAMSLAFAVRIARRGFTNRGVSSAIAENGTFLEHRPDSGGRTWLPAVGYRRGAELDNAGERRVHGLPPRPAIPPLHDVAARNQERGIERIDLETIIGTDAEEIAIAPGSLRRSWTENGRRYFHYATDAPIRNGFPILSARYAVHRSRWNDVAIEVLHHPKHVWNAERIARAARASLDSHSRHFGPYPHRQLRLVEFASPRGGLRLTGHPGTIVWSEAFAFAHPELDRREVDFPFAVVAHEVAHQWWGNQVVPARVEGAPLVSESLAWYSALLVVEETFGREHRDRVIDVMRESYLVPHATPDVPLLRANDWLGVYRSGALAMNALREAIGAERVNAALRALTAEYRSGRPPFPTSLDLYRHLRAVTPEAMQPLLKDLFEDVTFWDFRMKSVRASRIANAWRVTLDVEAYKSKVSGDGREHRVPMHDLVDIAVFDERGKPLYEQQHRIRSGRQTITVTVPRAPASAGIDADHHLLDRRRDDNVLGVQ